MAPRPMRDTTRSPRRAFFIRLLPWMVDGWWILGGGLGELLPVTTEAARDSLRESLAWGPPAVTPTPGPAFVQWLHDRLGAEPPRRRPGRDPGVPQHPPGADHPGAGWAPVVRRRASSGARATPRGGRAPGRGLAPVLHPPGAWRRRRSLRRRHRRDRPRAPPRRRRASTPARPASHRGRTRRDQEAAAPVPGPGAADGPAPPRRDAHRAGRRAQRTPRRARPQFARARTLHTVLRLR